MYFGTLLTRGKLNAFESVELSQLVISQNKKHLLDNWFKASQELKQHLRTQLSVFLTCLEVYLLFFVLRLKCLYPAAGKASLFICLYSEA